MGSSTRAERSTRGLQRRIVALTSLVLLGSSAAVACARDDIPTSPATTSVGSASLAHGAGGAHSRSAEVAMTPAMRKAVADLRAATAPFHRLQAAIDAGYADRVTGCLSDPVQGGMGFHYADLSRFDATLEALRPELLVYAPDPSGIPKLVAVEYAVPLADWTRPEPPSLYGLPFHFNDDFDLWVLHVWAWAPNPSGMFADFNPRVSCE
jgi:hypothetical protein